MTTPPWKASGARSNSTSSIAETLSATSKPAPKFSITSKSFITAFGIGYGAADRPCIDVFRSHGRAGERRTGWIGYRSRKAGGYLSAGGCRHQDEDGQPPDARTNHAGRIELHSESPPQYETNGSLRACPWRKE